VKGLSRRNVGERKNDAGIRHHRVWLLLLGCLSQHREILFGHLHVHLYGPFHASLYRGFAVAQQRY
jgi:hypothetical protein